MNKMEDSPGDNQSSSSSTTNKNDTSSFNNSNTLLHDINSLLNDDDISDITLIPEVIRGDDDITEVPAVKAILAARSPVFRRMLYGKFRETTNNTTNNSNDDDNENVKVKLDYSGKVLQLLVEFCFTDKLDSLSSNTNTNSQQRHHDEGGLFCFCASFVAHCAGSFLAWSTRATTTLLPIFQSHLWACSLFLCGTN